MSCCFLLSLNPVLLLQVFNNILHKCGLQCEGATAEPQKLEEKVTVTPGNMPLQVGLLLLALHCLEA